MKNITFHPKYVLNITNMSNPQNVHMHLSKVKAGLTQDLRFDIFFSIQVKYQDSFPQRLGELFVYMYQLCIKPKIFFFLESEIFCVAKLWTFIKIFKLFGNSFPVKNASLHFTLICSICLWELYYKAWTDHKISNYPIQ